MYLDLAGKHLFLPPGEGINRRKEGTGDTSFFCEVLMIIFQYCIFPSLLIKTVKISKLIFLLKNNQVLLTDQYFSVKDDNPKQEEAGSVE